MQDINPGGITIDPVLLPVFELKELTVSMLRLDKLHPVISGNKWFKLRFYLEEAHAQGKKTLLTFGGAWSNHIHATAAACRIHHLDAIGIIRGEEAAELSPTLRQAREMGMQLRFISRGQYREKWIPDDIAISNCLIVGEGGYGKPGAAGAATILDYANPHDYTHICCAMGTGTMLAGIMNRSPATVTCLGISVLKNNPALSGQVRALLANPQQDPVIIPDYHFGGYAKQTPELIQFMNNFYRVTGIPTDFVYTGKLCYAISALAGKNYFPPGSKILLIHSGGLQGNRSLDKGTLIF
ncbi:MAG: 1-aminocyclopropane-1-carboxylate deaminase [Sphingobacteriales bacterium]|nr:1-aminocyclopropane-1-carboxylate deaminase [Sphingobacteriales bacterium]